MAFKKKAKEAESSTKTAKNGRCPTCTSIVHSMGKGNASCKACGWTGKVA